MFYNIPYHIIQECVADDTLSSLYYYFRLRHIHRNRIFYNWQYRQIAYHLNISVSIAHKHIQVMLKKGWLVEKSGHLCLLGINKINKSWLIKVPIRENKKLQLAQFRYALIHKKLKKQLDWRDKKSELITNASFSSGKVTKTDMKLIRKCGGSERLRTDFNPHITLSNKTIGRQFNKSQKTGFFYQHLWNEMELIKSKPNYLILNLDITYEEYIYRYRLGLYKDYPFVKYDGKTKSSYTQLANKISFNENPKNKTSFA